MGRMHNPHKGIAGSALPYKRSAPRWLKISADEVKEHIFKLARKGLTPSQIGVVLRDSHGVAQVKSVTGNKPPTTSETYVLLSFFAPLSRSIKQIKKAVQVRKHLERNRNDKDSKFRLILIESRIHRLARYYRTKGQLAPTFKYEAASASTMIA
ncbi:40S ribosomal protein S13 [Rhodotorula toruloides]|nr:40S ribosomal protein S13 [Rhodotorula toruloides]